MTDLTEEERRKLREQTKEYMYRPPEDGVQSSFHYHFCRICHEDHECTLDYCELARSTICHNCYAKLEEGEV